MHRLLFIDDDKEVLTINKRFLSNNGYQVEAISNPGTTIATFSSFKPDCIILDIMMPSINGYQLCKSIREISTVPIILLSGRVNEEDKIKGLLLGADDYITKPYSLKELTARIYANIRRHQISKSNLYSTKLFYPPLTINKLEHKVYYNNEEIFLSNREYTLLLELASRPNEVITFQQLGQCLWSTYTEDDRRTIMVNVSRLRKKLETYIGLENLIETVWSKGYKFIPKMNR